MVRISAPKSKMGGTPSCQPLLICFKNISGRVVVRNLGTAVQNGTKLWLRFWSPSVERRASVTDPHQSCSGWVRVAKAHTFKHIMKNCSDTKEGGGRVAFRKIWEETGWDRCTGAVWKMLREIIASDFNDTIEEYTESVLQPLLAKEMKNRHSLRAVDVNIH